MRIYVLLLALFFSIAGFSSETSTKEFESPKYMGQDQSQQEKNVQIDSKTPRQFSLYQNYPNPFNPQTIIKIETAHETFIELTVYDFRGHKVRSLVSSTQPAGLYFVPWNGTDDQGNRLTSGIYYYRMRAGDFVDVKRMILLR